MSGAGDDTVTSPCVSICEIDPGSGLCRGCLRSLDEIAGWTAYSDDEKRAVLARLPERRSAAALREGAR